MLTVEAQAVTWAGAGWSQFLSTLSKSSRNEVWALVFICLCVKSFSYLYPLCLFGCFRRGIPPGPCTTHPYMLFIPRDSGVNPLPIYTKRGYSHLGSMGCTMVFY